MNHYDQQHDTPLLEKRFELPRTGFKVPRYDYREFLCYDYFADKIVQRGDLIWFFVAGEWLILEEMRDRYSCCNPVTHPREVSNV